MRSIRTRMEEILGVNTYSLSNNASGNGFLSELKLGFVADAVDIWCDMPGVELAVVAVLHGPPPKIHGIQVVQLSPYNMYGYDRIVEGYDVVLVACSILGDGPVAHGLLDLMLDVPARLLGLALPSNMRHKYAIRLSELEAEICML